MIDVKLQFKNNTDKQVLSQFLSLPPKLRPVYFCEDDRGKKTEDNLIENHDKFWDFFKENPAGFVMKGPGLNYDVLFTETTPITSLNSLKVSPDLAQTFLEHMSAAQPLFGFAGLWEEYVFRNQAIITHDVLSKINISSIERFIGKDIHRYLPGLYWLTLIPDNLLRKYNVPLKTLLDASVAYKYLPGDLHLVKFYNTPQEWEANQDKMNRLYDALPGVFNMRKIKPSLMEFKTQDELDTKLSQWP